MLKNICNYITLITILFFISSPTYADTVDSYNVTDGFEMTVPSNQKVYYYKNIAINYQSGRVVLSRNPDGTGESLIGESIDASVSNDDFEYKTNAKSCEGSISMKPLDITHLLKPGLNNVLVRYRTVWCSNQTVGPLYVVHFNDYEPTTVPFLDLPWDYQSKGMSFDDAATKMSSYFDHEYPILSANWFLQESENSTENILGYFGEYVDQGYSSHDGYDYAFDSGVTLNEPVLAAASGIATFHNNCSDCGNAIYIDHGNGYQSRYYHLQPDELITNNPNKKISVMNGQQIGKTGYTGNVNPSGAGGAHIHFMVIQDKNGDGSFEDNIPDGIIDPYGWQGLQSDPWENFTFMQNGIQKTGAKSSYLWKYNLSSLKKTLPQEGGTFTSNRFTFNFPNGATSKNLIFSLKAVSVSQSNSQLDPIGYMVEATADDGFGNLITQFSKLFTISMKILLTDYSRYKPESLSIYSSEDGETWYKENTQVDLTNRTATTQVNHLTYFAFMGEKKDSIAPQTSLLINNEEIGTTSIVYYNPVTISLQTTDQPSADSLGIENTFIKINDEDWQIYSNPILIENIGEHNIQYYAVDRDGNNEEINSVKLYINEKTLDHPEMQISFDFKEQHFTIENANENDTLLENKIIKKNKIFTEYSSSNQEETTSLITNFPNNEDKNIIRFKSIQYENDEPITLEKYRMKVFTKINKNDVEKIIQVLNMGDEERIRLAYNDIKDTTIIVTRKNGVIISKEIVDGFKKLVVMTDNGSFNFSIQ